jgi:hypothetical protein
MCCTIGEYIYIDFFLIKFTIGIWYIFIYFYVYIIITIYIIDIT